MIPLADDPERDRFITAQGKNISVIAPAGVGKTHTIVRRIEAIARGAAPELAADRLTRLVVVTYSVRAAQEMQQRARAAIRRADIPSRVQRAFQQTFFGTIHSYCVCLLERFGHHLGLPSPVALLQDEDDCWNRFLVRGLTSCAPSDDLRELFHFYAPEKLYVLGREISPAPVRAAGPCPNLEVRPLLAFPLGGLHPSTRKSIAAAQANVRAWNAAWARGDRFHPLPECPGTKQADFVALWADTFAPLNGWLREAALQFGRDIANAYENFRLAEAIMTYDDQVRLALRLLDLPAVRRELAEERLSVLLDEAQDTDPRQFDVLLRVAGLRLETDQGADQSFCVVGDFQQAIYVPRSDLGFYQKVHDEIIQGERGAESQFMVTFRCDEAVIDFVNRIFPSVLHGEDDQSEFFELKPRLGAGRGQVAKWRCPDEPAHAAGQKINAETRARHEAAFLAARLKELGPAGVGATAWSRVAILCPRRNWLLQIAHELRDAGLPIQFHSSQETALDRVASAWLAALVWVAAHPEDTFEIAGVLRDIFGVADDDLARFTAGDGERLRLDRAGPSPAPGPLADALALLRGLVEAMVSLPLHRILAELVGRTALRERLAAIDDLGNAGDDLDETLGLVFQRAAEGATLADLARELRTGLTQTPAGEEEIRDAIQLLTAHKAKGLEWETVILPYFFRDIESKSPAYPRLVRRSGGVETLYRDKDDYATHARLFEETRERQQLQRLLYVACTRARHTLLLVDDRQLFDGQRKRGAWSSGELLGLLDGVNRVTWEALPEILVPPDKTEAAAPPHRPRQPADKSLPNSNDEIEAALLRARDIPRRITPHALAVAAREEAEPGRGLDRPDEAPPSPSFASPGILYGTWWHEAVATLPWEKKRAAWQEHFDLAAARSPDPARARREWTLFTASPLAAWLEQPGLIIQREVPFLWPRDDRTCLEGVIDLAVCAPQAGGWRVIDWKTNRLQPATGATLAELYRGQIGAYVQALRAMLGGEVRGSLYLTASGEWLPLD
jgi:ATP-dependent exoDNAse (exonuclease V) beta subunit